MKLIVGLGNPGQVYARNRHNIGFMCLAYFAKKHGIRFDRKQGQARTGQGEVNGTRLVLARPQTGMNRSGESVNRLVKTHDINLGDLLVIHDDLDLPLGKIRISQGSSSGGHKGIESIIRKLGSADFIRIRVGIGRPDVSGSSNKDKEAEIIKYVLSDFTPEEKKTVSQVIPRVSEAIFCLIINGLTAAMNKFN